MPPDFLDGLNPNQREAVEAIDGPLLIIAGPGSGKTRVITHRAAYLVHTCGVSPYRIAAVTFTNKAAREMRQRLGPLIGKEAERLTVSTFHAFCAMVLRRDGDHIGLSRDFAIYDDVDQIALLKQSMEEANVDAKKFPPRAILSAISAAKSQLIGVEGYALNASSPYEEIVHRAYEVYERLLSMNSAVDFDDLLVKTHTLFDKVPDVSAKYQDRYVHFMIDEFQDTNIAQYAIARLLCSKYRNMCVVGDPDQSIYSWRNADIRNILSFKKDYPDARVIALEENYRSTQTILNAAQKLIGPNEQRLERELWTKNGYGVPITVAEGHNEREEAQLVLREVERLVRSDGYKRGQAAVMYRVNAQSRALEEACLRHGVPYQLIGSIRFYQRQEIKDVVAYLRLAAIGDDVSFSRVANVPTRGIGQRTMDELTRTARDNETIMLDAIDALAQNGHGPLSLAARSLRALTDFRGLIRGLAEEVETLNLVELIDLVLERTGYGAYTREHADRGEERWENIQEFRNSARDYVHIGGRDALTAFLEQVTLVSDVDSLEEKADALTLITLHQAKGLEFPVVFIVGMEEGLLPHIRALDNPEEMEEERRLCYVGVTRAKERLYLFRAFRRGFRGTYGGEAAEPSRFLRDIPRELIAAAPRGQPVRVAGASTRQNQRPQTAPGGVDGAATERAPTERPAESPPKPSLATGDKVRHATFGDGIVTGTKPSGADTEVTVAFIDGAGIKRLLLSFAPLEKVG